jgi:hypothetical protein
MKQELFKENLQEVPKKLLTIEDEQVLEYTLNKFKEYLGNIEKEKLPTIIILPETVSRPLYYAMKPIIEKIYKTHNVPLPDVHFLLTMRSPEREKLGYKEGADKKKIQELRSEIQELKKQKVGDYMKDSTEVFEKKTSDHQIKILEKKMDFQKESGWTEQRHDRFREIILSSRAGNILVIDDFISSYESIEQIERLKDLIPSQYKMEYFVLVDGRDSYYKVDRDYYYKIHIGLSDTNHKISGTTLWAFKGFSYSARPGVPWSTDYKTGFTQEDKESTIGVKKPLYPSKYGVKVETSDTIKMKQLRKEMTDIGQHIANQETFDEQEWQKNLTRDFDF